MHTSPVQILLVEDNEGDVVLMIEALKVAKVHNDIRVVHDGVEAMDYLHRRGPYAAAPRPDVILLDLNLPRMDGREVLAQIKAANGDLARIPVVILTSSSAERDVARAYDLHANCYVVKPVDFAKMSEVVRSIEHFWFVVAKLPPAPHG
jgi:two-component system, chemotaxis family, response regulator Rcp1